MYNNCFTNNWFAWCCILFFGAENGHDHEYYTEIVDKYITHNGRYGNPTYWVVYKFVDGCIEEMAVSSTEYYTTNVNR